jgi:hemolysin D
LNPPAEEGAKADKRNALTRLTAPVAGTVQQLAVHTSGGVVTPAQVLLVLVPDDSDVTAEVVLENKDIGFVQPGQAATIKLETFPYTRYGTVNGKVESITADAVQDEKRGAIFPITVVLSEALIHVDGKQIRLAPGMNLSAEIKTGRRRVIDYLLSPVQQHMDESMKER